MYYRELIVGNLYRGIHDEFPHVLSDSPKAIWTHSLLNRDKMLGELNVLLFLGLGTDKMKPFASFFDLTNCRICYTSARVHEQLTPLDPQEQTEWNR